MIFIQNQELALPIDLHKNILNLHLQDTSWGKSSASYQQRLIGRAIVMDQDKLLFVHVHRDDMFGKMDFLETSGGGIKKGEKIVEGLRRELQEELGITVDVICYLGLVDDYYNLISRENLNHYFLVRKIGDVQSHLMADERNAFHLTKASVTLEEARKVYEGNKELKLGKLLYQREMPVIDLAMKVIVSYGLY